MSWEEAFPLQMQGNSVEVLERLKRENYDLRKIIINIALDLQLLRDEGMTPRFQRLRAENRYNFRSLSLTPAKIRVRKPNSGSEIIECIIFDLSVGGASLLLVNARKVPDRFDLVLESNETYPCRVVWRTPKRIGVSFQPSA